jgi:uncharacterized protein YgiM (DUF1202 family)
MTEHKGNFFQRLKNEEHRGFEITMFSISICVAAAVLVTAILLIAYLHKANSTKISDEEVNATNVTESAVTVTEEPSEEPYDNAIVHGNEEDFDDDEADEELKNSDYGYTTTTVNMRSEGSLTATVVIKVPAGEKVEFVELQEDNKWMKVTYQGSTGYINVMYLTTTKPVATATPAPTTSTTTTTRTATPAPTTAAKKTAKPKATKTPKPTKKPSKATATPEEEETEEPSQTAVAITPEPTQQPTEKPTEKPTAAPTEKPTEPAANTEETSTQQKAE